MQTVFAEKTEDRSLDDNRHIGELFFIRMYWEKGRIPSGNLRAEWCITEESTGQKKSEKKTVS